MARLFILTLLIYHSQSATVYTPSEGDGPYPDDPTRVNAPFITCWEQNKYTYGGYHDPAYQDNPEYPQYTVGDVCDHTSPNTDPKNTFIRNVCKIEVRIGDCVEPYNGNGGGLCTRTWSRKCAVDTEDNGSDCPDGWKDAEDGCITTTQGSIVCCCVEDFCNTYMDVALLGFADADIACEVDAEGGCVGLRNVKDESDELSAGDVENENMLIDTIKYTITVSNAKDLADEDMDMDPFVEIYGYVNNGEDYKKFTTSVIDETTTPEWNEEFIFDELECGGIDDHYTSFVFKVYDDDSLFGVNVIGADFLGETRAFYTESVTECDIIYAKEMKLYRNEEESGTLFIEVTKDGCGTQEKEEKEEKEKGKNKERRLLYA